MNAIKIKQVKENKDAKKEEASKAIKINTQTCKENNQNQASLTQGLLSKVANCRAMKNTLAHRTLKIQQIHT